MNRRWHRCLLALAFVAVTVAATSVLPAAAQDAPVEIRNIDASGFPNVRAVVSGPTLEGELDEAFVVTEAGAPVSVDVVGLRNDQLHVLVAVDVSRSMEGEPLAQAKGAVAALLDTLSDEAKVGVVTFGNEVVLAHDFSADHASVRAAVDGLVAAGGTALYDGIERGLAELETITGVGSLVLLADGADSESRTSRDDVLTRLGASAGTIATNVVVLEGVDFDAAAMEEVASVADGELFAVDEADALTDTFTSIASGLSGLYEIRWRSDSEGTSSEVAIGLASAPDAAAVRSYGHEPVVQFVPQFAEDTRVVAGPSAALGAPWIPVAAAAGISLGAVIVLFALRTTEAAEERRAARRADKATKASAKAERARSLGGVQERLEEVSAHVLENKGRDRSLDDTLDRAGIAMRSNEFVVLVAAVALASFLVAFLLFGFPFFLLGALVPGMVVPGYVKFKIARRRKKFVEQLGDTLQLMAGSLTAGYGLGQALDSIARETDAPTCEEFQRVVMETRLGRSLEDALDAMSQRIQAEDFNWVVDAIKIQASVGGNLSEIINQVGDTIRARVRIRRQVDALTAEGKISALVLFVLPLGLFGFIWTSNPAYITPMFSSGMGQAMLGGAVFMLLAGGAWLRKLVNPEF